MKALSIRQPWAHLIVHGEKDMENRKWKTGLRGQVWIHASKTVDKQSYDDLKKKGVDLPPIEDLKTGGIIGIAEIADCVESSESEWFSGPFGFKLKNRLPVEFKPCPGRLYFFEPGPL